MKQLPLLALIVLFITTPLLAQQPDFYDEATLRTIELTFSQPDYWNQLIANKAAEIDISADLTIDGVTYPNVGVRFKGNSSYNSIPWSQKKSFKITMDSFVANQELMGYDKINLNNGFHDPTFMREVLSYNVLRRYMPASKANFMKLIINGSDWGLYVNIQQVDKEMLSEWFSDNDGNRYKCDPVTGGIGNSTLTWQGPNQAPYEASYELKSDPTPTTWTDLINVCDQLNNSTPATVIPNVDSVFAVDRSLWMLAFNSVFSSLDSYTGAGHNYYVYHDDQHGRIQTIPWDLNSAFGVFTNGGYTAQTIKTLDPLFNTNSLSHPLLSRLVTQPSIRDTYAAHIRTLLDEVFDWNILGPLVTQYQTLIDAEVLADPKKLYTYNDFLQNITQDVVIGNKTIPGLQDLVNTKRAFLTAHGLINRAAPTLTNVTQTPAQPTDSDTVTITVNATGPANGLANVRLRYRHIGAFATVAMFDDGLHGDGAAGDGVFGADIPPQSGGARIEYFIEARSNAPGVAKMFEPRHAEGGALSYTVTAVPVAGLVSINEFLAKNANGITDEMGQNEDWIEILNTASAPVVMDGLYLTDDIADPTQWQIPAGYTLQPGETLLIWADNDPTDGPLHATFKLGGSGEEIAIFDVDGTTLLDYVVFGGQVDDVSTGRLYDGALPFVTFSAPSPGALNEVATCGVRAFSAVDSTLHDMTLDAPSGVTVGQLTTFEARSAPSMSNVILAMANGGGVSTIPLSNVSLLLSGSLSVLGTIPADATGNADFVFTVPSIPALAGVSVAIQVFAADATPTIHGSNALELTICP